jgi:hypothetical protein
VIDDFPTCNFDGNGDTEDHQLIVQLAILDALRLVVAELRRPALEADTGPATEAIAAAVVQGLALELAAAAEILMKAADTLKYAGKGPEAVAVWTAAQRAQRAAAGSMPAGTVSMVPGAASDGSPR